jgi:hypothetical protein
MEIGQISDERNAVAFPRKKWQFSQFFDKKVKKSKNRGFRISQDFAKKCKKSEKSAKSGIFTNRVFFTFFQKSGGLGMRRTAN